MTRGGFSFGLGTCAVVWTAAEAKSVATLVVVSCRGTDSADLAEDDMISSLRTRGVSCVDPSAITSTLHTRARFVAQRVFDGIELDYDAVSWVTTDYGATRLLLATLELHDRELPYGEFTVHDMRAILSARCFDVRRKTLVGSGSVTRSAKGEDDAQVRFNVLRDSAEGLAGRIAASLTRS